MQKLHKDDVVKVIAGKHKGKTGKILSVQENMVVVDGVNVMKKAVKWKWFVDKIKPVHVSNVAYFDEKNGITKIGIGLNDKGQKIRIAKKTQKPIA